MYILSVRARGFRDLPSVTLEDCGRRVDLRGPSPETTALGDAIELVFAALSHGLLHRMALRWGLVADDALPDPSELDFPDELHGCDPVAAAALLAPGPRRSLHCSITLQLDPPLFGQLRDHASREPRVATALADKPTITVGVGALFTRSLQTMAIHVDEFCVGDVRFPVHGKERPAWIHPVLHSLANRHHRHDPADDIPEALLEAATSRDRHAAYRTWQQALAPDGPLLRIARDGSGLPILMGDDLPLRRHGLATSNRAALAAAIHLSGADIFWAESEDPLLEDAIQKDPSPLEQVFSIGPGGSMSLTVDPPEPTGVLTAKRAWGRNPS